MLSRDNKIGLVLAVLLGLADIAFLAALSGDGSDKPPVAVVVLSVAVGVATLVLVALAWRAPTRPLMLAIIGLRVVSALGDIPGFFQNAGIVITSVVHLVVSLVCIALLRSWVQRPVDAPSRTRADASH